MALGMTSFDRTTRARMGRLSGKVAFLTLVLVLLAPTMFIFFWMASLSLKNELDNTAYPPVFIPHQLELGNYAEIFSANPFLKYAANSTIIAAISTAIALALGAPAAYGIARGRMFSMASVILLARMIPGLSYLIPWYVLFQHVGLSNTYVALILTHIVVGLPIVIWVLMSFFEEVPIELEEASLIDGCSRFGAFRHIALPLVRPGLAIATILAVVASWNNFVFAVILAGPDTRTLPVAIFNLISYEQANWGPLAAAALVVTLPMVLMTLLLQRHIVAGMTTGGIKG